MRRQHAPRYRGEKARLDFLKLRQEEVEKATKGVKTGKEMARKLRAAGEPLSAAPKKVAPKKKNGK